MYAMEYRLQARRALKGKWMRVVLLLLLATLLGAGAVGGSTGVQLSASSDFKVSLNSEQSLTPEGQTLLLIACSVAAVMTLWSFFMGSWVSVGTTVMLNRTLDGETPRARMLFPKGIYGKCLGLRFMSTLFVYLWTLLLIVPGIIASYRYAMAQYLLCTHPEMGVMEAIQESKAYMKGRKWRLFCLQLSFIGWQLLSLLPLWLMGMAGAFVLAAYYGGAGIAGAIGIFWVLIALGALLSYAANLLVQAYSSVAVVAFFREAQRAGKWKQEAQAGADYATGAYGDRDDAAQDSYGAAENFARDYDANNPYSANLHGEYPQPTGSILTADETVAKDMFQDYHCSRQKMREAGVLEEYEALHASSVSEMRWLRAYGDALMRRFDQDSDALDDILALAAEYEMADLTDRALQRVERHIRQQSLPDAEIMNMAGRILALLVSGAFAQNEGFVRRKQEQIADMADRLEHRLNENEGEGEWKRALELIREMCK